MAHYRTIEGSEAWADWMARLVQLRDSTKLALERGQLDKYGRPHDDEQRAVLYVINQLIGYVPSIKSDYDSIKARLEAEEAQAGKPLYGMDQINSLTEDF